MWQGTHVEHAHPEPDQGAGKRVADEEGGPYERPALVHLGTLAKLTRGDPESLGSDGMGPGSAFG
ncbi:MAG: lasso RiPP family leader peptide-containing protein [Solirubrobacteraceae bacterium]